MAGRIDAVTKQAQSLRGEALAKAREIKACAQRLEQEMPPSDKRTALAADLALLELTLTKIGDVQN